MLNNYILRYFGKKVNRGVKFNNKVIKYKEEKRLKSGQKYTMESLNISKPNSWLTNPKRLKAFALMLQTNRNNHRFSRKPLNKEDKDKFVNFKMDFQFYKYKEFLLKKFISENRILEEKNLDEEIETLPYRIKNEIIDKKNSPIEELPEELDPKFLYYGQMINFLPQEITQKIALERRLDLIFKDKLIE